jgi:NAD-dependent dihydropyrimidine dehydrogenase PreA subunit
MIEVVIGDRCTLCNLCVEVCPTNVFDGVKGVLPVIARQEDCQTCFMCELYCPTDALYVAPDCEGPTEVDEAALVNSPDLGRYRRDSGWGQWRKESNHRNESWRMTEIFSAARDALKSPDPY